jgi:hypothetical protein
MPRPSQLLPDTVIARLVRNKAFRETCFDLLRQAQAMGNKGQQIQALNASLDQLEADGSLSQSERAAIRADDIIALVPDEAVVAALEAINHADDINAA